MRFNMPPAISLQQLGFSYRTQAVLQDINLDIPHQSLLALIGPNGSGKTTLLRVMSKALRPQRGTVEVDGQPLFTFSARKLAQKLAVISSEQHFEFPFSVADVVAMGRFPHLNRLERMSDRDWKIVAAVGFDRPGDPVFNAVHDLAVGRDGSIYVAETRTKRVVKLRPVAKAAPPKAGQKDAAR